MKLYDSLSEEEKREKVRLNGYKIQYITNPSLKIQKIAVKQNGYSISYIDNPSEEVVYLSFVSLPSEDYYEHYFFNIFKPEWFTDSLQERLVKTNYRKDIPIDWWSKEIKQKYPYLFGLSKIGII